MIIRFQVFSEGRATRSSKKVEQWTEVPLLAKLLKLLVNEMQNCVEEVFSLVLYFFGGAKTDFKS